MIRNLALAVILGALLATQPLNLVTLGALVASSVLVAVGSKLA